MRETHFDSGRQVSYDHSVDGDGYDVLSNIDMHEDITVIDGVAYNISSTAPEPIMYGVGVQTLVIYEEAGEKATMDVYDYTKDEYSRGISIPAECFINCLPYKPDRRKTIKNLHEDDYRRQILPPEAITPPVMISTMPVYNYRPEEI